MLNHPITGSHPPTDQQTLLSHHFNLILLYGALLQMLSLSTFWRITSGFLFMRKKSFNITDTNLGSITGRDEYLQVFFHDARQCEVNSATQVLSARKQAQITVFLLLILTSFPFSALFLQYEKVFFCLFVCLKNYSDKALAYFPCSKTRSL